MKKRIKALFVLLVVLAVLQTVGGIVYLSFTAAEDKRYTDVECTITEVKTTVVEPEEPAEDGGESEGESVTIDAIIVTYLNANGEIVEATLADYPSTFQVGTVLNGRYKDNPASITLEQTDWFTPSLLLAMGVAYGIGTIVLFAMRKRMGWYALDEGEKDNAPEQEEEENTDYPENQTLDSSIFGASKEDNK